MINVSRNLIYILFSCLQCLSVLCLFFYKCYCKSVMCFVSIIISVFLIVFMSHVWIIEPCFLVLIILVFVFNKDCLHNRSPLFLVPAVRIVLDQMMNLLVTNVTS